MCIFPLLPSYLVSGDGIAQQSPWPRNCAGGKWGSPRGVSSASHRVFCLCYRTVLWTEWRKIMQPSKCLVGLLPLPILPSPLLFSLFFLCTAHWLRGHYMEVSQGEGHREARLVSGFFSLFTKLSWLKRFFSQLHFYQAKRETLRNKDLNEHLSCWSCSDFPHLQPRTISAWLCGRNIFFTPFHISPLAPNLIDNILGKVRLYPIADKPCWLIDT